MGQWGVLMDMSTILLMIMSRGKYFQTQIEMVRMAKNSTPFVCKDGRSKQSQPLLIPLLSMGHKKYEIKTEPKREECNSVK